jgi:hypothetical protein
MSASFQKVSPPVIERRHAKRIALRMSATIRERERARFRISVVDISLSGCRIETPTSLIEGAWLWLSVSGLETQYCCVVWSREGFAGLEFAVPLHEAVLDSLPGASCVADPAEINILRDISLRCLRTADTLAETPEVVQLRALSKDCVVQAKIGELRLVWNSQENANR